MEKNLVRKLSKKVLSEEELDKLQTIKLGDLGLGYDKYGTNLDSVILAYGISKYLYDYWFRVESFGHENLPATGRAIVVPNHSGVMAPLDGVMIGVDIANKTNPTRFVRGMVDRMASAMPFVGVLFSRIGQVTGTRRNFEEMLADEEMVVVFPEGTPGISKHYTKRYQLQYFNIGFIELALQNQTPLVPVAVVGAEEQHKMIHDSKLLGKILDMPVFPVTTRWPWLGPLGLIPLPVKIRIYYGEQFHFYKDYPPEAAADPNIVKKLRDEVRDRVQSMINKGLAERDGIF